MARWRGPMAGPRTCRSRRCLRRLVALNKERAAEERAGTVQWLRPEYQIPRFGSAADLKELELVGGDGEGMTEEAGAAKKPPFPKSDVEQTIAITLALSRAIGPITAEEIARQFAQGRKIQQRVEYTLKAMARMGELYTSDGTRFQLRRVA